MQGHLQTSSYMVQLYNLAILAKAFIYITLANTYFYDQINMGASLSSVQWN